MLATLPKNVDEKNVDNTFYKMLVSLPKILTKKCWHHFWKILTKNVGKLLKNVKKNVGNTPENVDEKMLEHFWKMVTRKCWNTFVKCWRKILATFLKNCDEKILQTVKKIINKKSQSAWAFLGLQYVSWAVFDFVRFIVRLLSPP
jgi:hypothetical protein